LLINEHGDNIDDYPQRPVEQFFMGQQSLREQTCAGGKGIKIGKTGIGISAHDCAVQVGGENDNY
jgi:hypothetical protein